MEMAAIILLYHILALCTTIRHFDENFLRQSTYISNHRES